MSLRRVMDAYKHKTGPGKTYTPEELALFARYGGERARVRPKACNSGPQCWVEQGPPAITNAGKCLGCRGRPRSTTAPGYYARGRHESVG